MDPSLQQEIMAALALSRLPGVGAATFKRLILEHKSPRLALAAFSPPVSPSPKSATREGLSLARRYLSQGGEALYLGGPGYPDLLAALGEPPPVLFVRGEPETLSSPLLAVVGARQSDEEGLRAARAIVRKAVAMGFGIVSGGARGIDHAAHTEALSLGAKTVAVLGTGIDVVYPPEHGALFAKIARQGAVVTELLPEAPPARSFFLTRNRIIAGLARGVIAVRGRARSGALTTATWAFRLSRPVAAPLVKANKTRPEDPDPLGELSRLLQTRGATLLHSEEDLARWLMLCKTAPQRGTLPLFPEL